MAEEWTLFYWAAKSAGRAEFVRLLFEEAGVKYKEDNEDTLGKFFQGKIGGNFPPYAPPMIRKGSFQLSQTPVICRYLGKEFGLFPDKFEDEWHAEQFNLTLHDYVAEGRNSFHGINLIASYFTQQEETKPYIERFVKDRIPRYLKHFEQVLSLNNNGQGFVFGNKLTYVDLGLLHVLRATEAQFPDTWKEADYIPNLKAFKERIETRPNIAAYLKSDRWLGFEGNSMM